jgi:predicted AAA+ superfamily ATPase
VRAFSSRHRSRSGGTAEQFFQLFRGDYAKYERLIKELNIKAE